MLNAFCIVRKTNRNGSRKEPRDDTITSRTGNPFALPAAKLCIGASADGIEPTGRVPATVWQGVLWKYTQRDEVRMQHGVAARYSVPVSPREQGSAIPTPVEALCSDRSVQ